MSPHTGVGAPRNVLELFGSVQGTLDHDQYRQLDGRYLPDTVVEAFAAEVAALCQPDSVSLAPPPQRQITSPFGLAPGVRPTVCWDRWTLFAS